MKIIISPAKKLDTKNLINKGTSIHFIEEAKYLANELKKYTEEDLKTLMKLSDKLSNLNWNRYQNWNAKGEGQAIFMFQGDVYQGLDVSSFDKNDLKFAQSNLRILSGLYGILKPTDLINPYRLEMGTKLKNKSGNNLYKFWENKLNTYLKTELCENEEIINLASDEYSKAIQLKSFSNPVITPIFKDYKNGKLKVISFFAKKARGEMVNFIVKNKINDVNELKNFSNIGYKFDSENQKGELIFTR